MKRRVAPLRKPALFLLKIYKRSNIISLVDISMYDIIEVKK